VAEPGDGHPVADGVLGDSSVNPLHDADAFVTGNERRSRLDRPISTGGVDVGMAQTTGFDLDQHLTCSRFGHVDVQDLQWSVESGDNRRAHGLLLLSWSPISLSSGPRGG
jgi:hypothetical protein